MDLRRQLRSVITWENPAPEVLFTRWTSNGDEIKSASKLIVGPGQGCIFVYEGKVEGVYTQPGMVELKTANIPFWTTITKFMQSFRSEHQVGLFFFKTSQLTDIKWGTPSVIKYEDPKYKFPVGLRAFGNFSMAIQKPDWFFVNVVGTRETFLIEDFRDVISARIMQSFSTYLAAAKFSYAEIDAHRQDIAQATLANNGSEFEKLGFQLMDFRIEGTSFDEDTQRRIGRIADMSAEAQAASAAGLSYAQLQQLEALKSAAQNPGGAGMIMGMGVGVNMGQQVAGVAGGANFGGIQGTDDPQARLKKLKDLFDQGLISEAEFAEKKKEILSKI